MGKIMRRSDSALDYVPTQYITDFVKSIIHDGVAEYAGVSAVSPKYKHLIPLAFALPSVVLSIGGAPISPIGIPSSVEILHL